MATINPKTKTAADKTKVDPKAAKTSTAVPKATVTAAPVVAAPKAVLVEDVKTVVADAPIKKPELIDRVMAETGLKKKDVKPVVEAMLTVLGRALTNGEELTVPPLGKLMINRTKEVSKATIVNLKLRHPKTDSTVAKNTDDDTDD